jgi:FkbM family methyltransferase
MARNRILKSLARWIADCRAAFRIADGTGPFLRLVGMLTRLRLAPRLGLAADNRNVLCTRLRPGITVACRQNQGDLFSLTEVWIRECYRLPFDVVPGTLVDLGANIGLTSLWFNKRYQFRKVLAIEPNPSNVTLARENFKVNDVPGKVIQAAVGANDRTGLFSPHVNSNQGGLGRGETGYPVQVYSMNTILDMLTPAERVNLLKVDIEGGEQELFTGDLSWLGTIDALIIEFHPDIVEYRRLITNIEKCGFRFIRNGTVWPENMDCFVNVRTNK